MKNLHIIKPANLIRFFSQRIGKCPFKVRDVCKTRVHKTEGDLTVVAGGNIE